ncbi:MAG TPA: type II secretion system minor pseudopilin GspI [Candidatus Sphingomonas excrementigallinarum]|nr:type II secretion system minor pseudopilin GspI [Candidatus Sphingomonas excrementigallinarum]
MGESNLNPPRHGEGDHAQHGGGGVPQAASFVEAPLRQRCALPPPRAGEEGFTLIEIMVALAVFSLAAMALVRLESATIRGAGILDETVVAQMVARNVAIAAVTDPQAPALGRTSGVEVNGGRSWKWTRIVSGTGDARVVRIDVAVANAGGSVAGRMTMVRPPMTVPPIGVSAS